jgi:hypothetical protein
VKARLCGRLPERSRSVRRRRGTLRARSCPSCPITQRRSRPDHRRGQAARRGDLPVPRPARDQPRGRIRARVGATEGDHSRIGLETGGDVGARGVPVLRVRRAGAAEFGPALRAPARRPGRVFGPQVAFSGDGHATLLFQEKTHEAGFSVAAPLKSAIATADGSALAAPMVVAGNDRAAAVRHPRGRAHRRRLADRRGPRRADRRRSLHRRGRLPPRPHAARPGPTRSPTRAATAGWPRPAATPRSSGAAAARTASCGSPCAGSRRSRGRSATRLVARRGQHSTSTQTDRRDGGMLCGRPSKRGEYG